MEGHLRDGIQSHLVFMSDVLTQIITRGHYPHLVCTTAGAPVTEADIRTGLGALNLSMSGAQTNVTSGLGTFSTATSTNSYPLHHAHSAMVGDAYFSDPLHLKAYVDNGANRDKSVTLTDYNALLERTRHQDITLAKQKQQIIELHAKVQSYEKQLQAQAEKMKQYEQCVLDMETRLCNGTYVWKVEHFSQLRRDAVAGMTTAVHSPGFYSSIYGYRLCVRLNPNGVESGLGTHMSLFIHFMKGAYDTILEWPFSGKITLYVLDQNNEQEYRRDIFETLVAKPDLAAFQRPLSSRNHRGFGYIEFAPIDLIERAVYVKNDTLIIKVSVVEH